MVKILQQLKLWLSVVIMPTRNLTHFIGYTYTFPRVLFFFFDSGDVFYSAAC